VITCTNNTENVKAAIAADLQPVCFDFLFFPLAVISRRLSEVFQQ